MGPWRHLELAASLAEGGEQPLPPWMETLDQIWLAATSPGFLGEGHACDGYLRTKQSPLKRPKPMKTAPHMPGSCQLISTLCERWELPKLNSPFISPGLLCVGLLLFLVCL